MPKDFDVVIVGLGIMGSSALHACMKEAKQSQPELKVLGIEQFTTPHAFGSSHGESRMTRLTTLRGKGVVELTKRTLNIYHEIEREQKCTLHQKTGGIMIGPSHVADGALQKLRAEAKANSVAIKDLSAADIRATYPQFKVKDSEDGYYEETVGMLDPEKCVSIHLRLAEQLGATIHMQEKVESFSAIDSTTMLIKTNKDSYQAKKVVLTAGPWMPKLLGSHGAGFMVHRAALYWFDVDDSAKKQYQVGTFPLTTWDIGQGRSLIAFPMKEGESSLKVMRLENIAPDAKLAPDTVDRVISAREIDETYAQFIAPYLHKVLPRCAKNVVCVYTTAPQQKFVVDFLPEFGERVVAVSVCARQGFKCAAGISESIAGRIITNKHTQTMNVFELFGHMFSIPSNVSSSVATPVNFFQAAGKDGNPEGNQFANIPTHRKEIRHE